MYSLAAENFMVIVITMTHFNFCRGTYQPHREMLGGRQEVHMRKEAQDANGSAEVTQHLYVAAMERERVARRPFCQISMLPNDVNDMIT